MHALANALNVSVGELATWLDGEARAPDAVFIIALDLAALKRRL
jgi:hypothetical protein